jgi:hypothetical protein
MSTTTMSKLTVNQVYGKLKVTDFSVYEKPGKNKGARGQLLETALGVPNSSDLKDLEDGEIKTFTVGESIAATQLKHCLSEIIEDSISFDESKVGQKLKQTVYVAFSRNNDYVGTEILNEETHPEHYQELREDYEFICEQIRTAFERGVELDQLGFVNRRGKASHTITGPNKLLQIRTKASKTKRNDYTPLTFADVTFNNKGMAFYLCGQFGRNLF